MIKLTCVRYDSTDGKLVVHPDDDIWVAPAAIATMRRGVVTGLRLIGSNQYLDVLETPEEIMAMPEMVKLTNPLVSLNAPTGTYLR